MRTAERRTKATRLAVAGAVALTIAFLASGCVLKGTWTDAPFASVPWYEPPPPMSDISCPTAESCIAVGHDGGVVRLQRSTGTTWSAVPATLALPVGGLGWWGDAEISCWSATGCVFRVGYGDASGFFHEVLHRWDGTAITPISAPDGIRDLDCTGPTTCTVLSGGLGSRLLRWDGSTWTDVAPDIAPDVALGTGTCGDDWCVALCARCPGGAVHIADGVATYRELPFSSGWDLWCESATLCHASKYDEEGAGAIASWDGTAWVERTLPDARGSVRRIEDVSCASPIACVAIATLLAPVSSPSPETLAWWGADSWHQMANPTSWYGSFDGPWAIDCAPGSTRCGAIGPGGGEWHTTYSSFFQWP